MHIVSKVSNRFPRYIMCEISWTPWKLRAFSGSVQVAHSLFSCSVCRLYLLGELNEDRQVSIMWWEVSLLTHELAGMAGRPSSRLSILHGGNDARNYQKNTAKQVYLFVQVMTTLYFHIRETNFQRTIKLLLGKRGFLFIMLLGTCCVCISTYGAWNSGGFC